MEHRKLPVNLLIYDQVVFHWHGGVADNFGGETINRKDMGHPKHCQFFILVYMQFVTHVLCTVWDWI